MEHGERQRHDHLWKPGAVTGPTHVPFHDPRVGLTGAGRGVVAGSVFVKISAHRVESTRNEDVLKKEGWIVEQDGWDIEFRKTGEPYARYGFGVTLPE